MWDKIKNWFANFMTGRYGMDDFNKFLLVLFFILFILETLLGGAVGQVLYLVTLLILIYMYFRMLSRNQYARAEENLKYNQIKNRITGVFRGEGRAASSDQDHKIFMCPQCGQKVRVPRGRGRVQIRCPKCGRQFIKRT